MFSADQIVVWTQSYYWPFLRLSALFLASPIFSASSFPVRGRIILAVLITALIMPSLPSFPVVEPLSATGLLLAGQQVVIGLAMGFILQMVFAAVVIGAFGVITRVAPQLNIFAVGFPVTIMAGFVFITLSMPSVFDRFVSMFDAGLAQALSILR